MTDLIIRTEPLGGSALARAALEGRLGDWYVARPRTPDEWRARAASVQGDFRERAWLDAMAPALDATGAAATRLGRVARGGGVLVTTGQQPGLFGGPLYAWSKALSALALANEIERATGVPAAPLFWAANDDADFAEASWTAVAVAGGAERLVIEAGAPLGRPMSEMPLGDPSTALDALARACGATVDDRPLAAVRDAYRRGATVGGAYLELLRRLFAPLGIAVLDAAHEAVAKATRPFLVRALERADDVAAALRDRDAAIEANGFTPQVAEVAGLSLVFERPAAGGEKRRLNIREVGAALSAASTAVLSPNVLLRPIVERAIMPTVAYVAGPGEIAYFAQATAVAPVLGLALPLVVPRWSTTILEPHVVRILRRLGLTVEELADPHRAESRLARDAVPSAVERTIAELRHDLDRRIEVLADAATDGAVGVPPAVLDGARRALHHRIDRLDRRIVAAVKRRESDTMRQVATARGALYPLGTRQERAASAVPFLARHGSAVVEGMIAGATAHARSLVHGGAASPSSHVTGVEDARGTVGVESARTPDA